MAAKKKPSAKSLKNLKKWPKGVSGNPGGRPKKLPITETLRALLLEDPDLAKKLLLNMIRMATSKDGGSEAVAAFRAIAERAEGKPVQPVDIDQRETLRVVIDL